MTESFAAFKQILTFARENLNAPVQAPEIVLIGPQGHGKSSLLEALIGHPLTVVGDKEGGVTKRAIHISLVNNPDCAVPRVTIKKDTKGRTDRVVELEELEEELQARNVVSAAPIQVVYEVRNCWNVTYIDTPGLIMSNSPSSAQSEVGADEVEEMILDLIRPAHRLIVAVEEVKDGSSSVCMSLVKRVDPRLDRTIFVFNKFRESLKHFATSRDLNRYLSNISSLGAPTFFTSLLTGQDRGAHPAKGSFQKTLEDQVDQDLKSLEALQYDRKYASSVGFPKVKRFVVQYVWRKYQDVVPELLKRLRSLRRQTDQQLTTTRSKMDLLKDSKLRAFSTQFVMQFLQNIENLIAGTLDGNPAVHGQSLEEEKSSDETGEWRDSDWHQIVFDPIEWKISHARSKLYGGQQFERLLAEFKAVVDHQTIPELTSDEIATAAGPYKLGHVSNYTWATSDIVQRLVQKRLRTLLNQLIERGKYVFRRLVRVEAEMFENNASGSAQGNSFQSLGRFPDFRERVKNMYLQFVDETAEKCKAKCIDEFMSTRLIYWELTNFDSKSVGKLDSKEDARKAVTKLTNDLFNKIKQRTAQNIMLKTYNFFLVPMQSDLWSKLQGELTSLTDEDLHNDFKTTQLEAVFKNEESQHLATIKKLEADESSFTGFANTFAKAPLNSINF